MPTTPLRLTAEAAHDELAARLAQLPGELELSREFPPEVEAEAQRVAAERPLPDADRTDLEFVTLDPEGSSDLDQAFAIERDGSGWIVFYAIADVPAFVAPGGAIDAEARTRGQTVYAADGRIPLHPTVISEGAASLLPGKVRGAFVWEHHLAAGGEVTRTRVARARIRSRRQLDYLSAQSDLDHRSGPDAALLAHLREVGQARVALEAHRGGASLSTPEILVSMQDGRYTLDRRAMLPIETWNAQLSLMTGMAAAQMMLDGGVGILRTMPPADEGAVAKFRRQTRALGVPWPEGQRYGDYLRTLDGTLPTHLAILHAAASLFRGAGYTPFDGAPPTETLQAAVGAPYAHVTAPLRRLVDRFGLVICEAHSTGADVPAWAREALPELPKIMARSSNTANRLDRMTLDAVEAALLAPRIGAEFDAVVLSAGGMSGSNKNDGGTVQLTDPAVEGVCDGHLEPGTDVRVRLVQADIATGTIRFVLAQ
ncbi:MAG TPA: RNB domain-containing ribonuclease [Pseudolysinimonas sp.]|nr:RNB domain-containing ribonuclease [Pseudolysinimonas sp.]